MPVRPFTVAKLNEAWQIDVYWRFTSKWGSACLESVSLVDL